MSTQGEYTGLSTQGYGLEPKLAISVCGLGTFVASEICMGFSFDDLEVICIAAQHSMVK